MLRDILADKGYVLLTARSGQRALDVAARRCPTLVLLDIHMPPGIDGFEVCRQLKADPATSEAVVIFLSAMQDTESKIEGFKVGAVDYIEKPFDVDEVLARVRTHLRLKRLERELAARNSELEHEIRVAEELLREARDRVAGPLLGDSQPAQLLRGEVEWGARHDGPVLLVGEPGCGEEAVARAIHHRSERRGALIQVDGLEVRGDPSRLKERFDLALGGTLFVSHTGLIPEAVQEEQLQPLLTNGAARVVLHVATNGDGLAPPLIELVQQHLRLPPLVRRLDDLPVLAEHMVRRQAARLGRSIEGIEPESLERLAEYAWPGNLRELAGVLECAIVASRSGVLHIDEALLEGGRRAGHYRLIEKIGKGGMGEVWRASHRLLKRQAAVKLIHPSRTRNVDRAQARFEREARATAALESPNTVRLYDFGLTDDGAFYYVMEYLRGLDLGSLVETHGPISPARAVYLMAQVAGSLAEAHGAGLVHCDIKPENIFVSTAGVERDLVKVLDFGIVRSWGVRGAEGEIIGTPAFMAPELTGGMRIDGRADLYALGCVLFFALTGRLVFEVASGVAMVAFHVTREPPRLSEVLPSVPRDLDDLVWQLLRKDPAERPQTAAEVRERLLSANVGTPPWTSSHGATWWATIEP